MDFELISCSLTAFEGNQRRIRRCLSHRSRYRCLSLYLYNHTPSELSGYRGMPWRLIRKFAVKSSKKPNKPPNSLKRQQGANTISQRWQPIGQVLARRMLSLPATIFLQCLICCYTEQSPMPSETSWPRHGSEQPLQGLAGEILASRGPFPTASHASMTRKHGQVRHYLPF